MIRRIISPDNPPDARTEGLDLRDNPGHPRLAGDADHFGDRRDEDDPVAALSAHMAGVESVERRGDETRLSFGQPGPDLSRVRVGDRVFATSDPALASATARDVREDAPEPEGRNQVDLVVCGEAGAPLQVVATCRGHRASAQTTSALQPARGAGLDAAILADKLAAFAKGIAAAVSHMPNHPDYSDSWFVVVEGTQTYQFELHLNTQFPQRVIGRLVKRSGNVTSDQLTFRSDGLRPWVDEYLIQAAGARAGSGR